MGVPVIRTVQGDVPADDVGSVLAHEHVIVDLSFRWDPAGQGDIAGASVSLETLQHVRRTQWALRDNLRLQDVALAVRELGRYVAAGGDLVVEVSSRGIGRDVRALRWIADRSGARIVAGTGEYVAGSHPPGLAERSIDAIAAEMVRDITVGVAGTGIRTGVIGEVGAGQHPMVDAERLVLRAAAQASQATGAAIVAHPAPGIESAYELARTLLEAGADPWKICIAHLDDRFRGDPALFRRLAETDVRFGFDTFGREAYYAPRDRQHPSDAERITALVALADAGLLDRVMLSHDLCMKLDLAAFGGTGYDHVLVGIVPRLRSAGFSDGEIGALTSTTARDWLALPAAATDRAGA